MRTQGVWPTGSGERHRGTEPSAPVEGLKGVKVVTVAAGGACSFVVTATGELYGWGMGTNLQLEMSDEEDVWTPERVTGKKMANRRTLAVSVGGQHTALLVSSSVTEMYCMIADWEGGGRWCYMHFMSTL